MLWAGSKMHAMQWYCVGLKESTLERYYTWQIKRDIAVATWIIDRRNPGNMDNWHFDVYPAVMREATQWQWHQLPRIFWETSSETVKNVLIGAGAVVSGLASAGLLYGAYQAGTALFPTRESIQARNRLIKLGKKFPLIEQKYTRRGGKRKYWQVSRSSDKLEDDEARQLEHEAAAERQISDQMDKYARWQLQQDERQTSDRTRGWRQKGDAEGFKEVWHEGRKARIGKHEYEAGREQDWLDARVARVPSAGEWLSEKLSLQTQSVEAKFRQKLHVAKTVQVLPTYADIQFFCKTAQGAFDAASATQVMQSINPDQVEKAIYKVTCEGRYVCTGTQVANRLYMVTHALNEDSSKTYEFSNAVRTIGPFKGSDACFFGEHLAYFESPGVPAVWKINHLRVMEDPEIVALYGFGDGSWMSPRVRVAFASPKGWCNAASVCGDCTAPVLGQDGKILGFWTHGSADARVTFGRFEPVTLEMIESHRQPTSRKMSEQLLFPLRPPELKKL